MIAIVDYGVGNLFSLSSGLRCLGLESQVTGDAGALRAADRIILPGVGAFGDAARRLRQSGLWEVLLEQAGRGKPLLGICLGMQLLFQSSEEYGDHQGLGVIPGRVASLRRALDGAGRADLKVPHIGWNALQIVQDDPLFAGFACGSHVYYVHSFYARDCAAATLAVSEYGIPVTGVVKNGNVYGTQFHPEKSGDAGLALLEAFARL